MDKEQKLRTLTKKEIATLYLICQGLTNPQIVKALHSTEKTIGTRITKIYLKLEIEGDDQQKRLILQREYCPFVRKFSDEDLRYWVPEYPSPEVKIKYEIIEYQYPEPESEPDDEPEPPYIPPKPPKPRADETYVSSRVIRRLILLFLAIITILVVGFAILYFFFPPEKPLIPIAPPLKTSTQTPESLIETVITPTAANGMKTEEVILPAASTHTSTVTPSMTPAPSSTPEPTLTATATETPLPPFFYDDFDQGPKPDWVILSDEINFVGGEAVFTGNYGGWMYVAAPDSPDFVLEYKLTNNSSGNWGYMVSPAFVDPNNYYGFRSTCCDQLWIISQNGRYAYIGDILHNNNLSDQTAIMTVNGSNIDLVINGIIFPSGFNNKIESGLIGFYVDGATRLDEVKITVLNK